LAQGRNIVMMQNQRIFGHDNNSWIAFKQK